jgi:hypothetical protein
LPGDNIIPNNLTMPGRGCKTQQETFDDAAGKQDGKGTVKTDAAATDAGGNAIAQEIANSSREIRE